MGGTADALLPFKVTFANREYIATHFEPAGVHSVLAGVQSATPLLEHFGKPMAAGTTERRWLEGFYLDQQEEWDDPYRFFRW